MEWFERLPLINKIETYSELMYDLGTREACRNNDDILQEKALMYELIKKEVANLHEE